jgi:hypothetical protein
LEKYVLFLPKVSLFLQFVLLFKTKKNTINLYYTWEPFLLVKDDNYVAKEYEEVNEKGVAARKWGCIFLLVKEDNFTQWIKKALRPCTWQNRRRLESTWKEEIRNAN